MPDIFMQVGWNKSLGSVRLHIRKCMLLLLYSLRRKAGADCGIAVCYAFFAVGCFIYRNMSLAICVYHACMMISTT